MAIHALADRLTQINQEALKLIEALTAVYRREQMGELTHEEAAASARPLLREIGVLLIRGSGVIEVLGVEYLMMSQR